MLEIDLSKQEYPVFNVDGNHLLELSSKNFIFGKNGTGKSTLTSLIKSQYSCDYDVRVFTGLENLLIDDKLNAVVLGEENIDIKTKVEELDVEILELENQLVSLEKKKKSLDWDEVYSEEGITPSKEFNEVKQLESDTTERDEDVKIFYSHCAQRLKNLTKPQLTPPTYNRNDFRNDIQHAKHLDQAKLIELNHDLKEEPKSILDEIIFEKIKFIELYDSVNQLIQTKLTESISLPELKDNPDKKEFAKRGKEIHSQGDNCAFCGSKYTLEREQKLNIYFSADDIKILQDNLNVKLNEINEYKVKVSTLQGMKKEDFYISLHQEVQSLNFKISNKKNEIEVFLEKLENVIIDKQRDLFSAKNGLTIILPNNFDEEEKIVNELVSKNNQYTTNFSEQHSEKKEQIKFHIISEYLNEKEKYKEGWKGHEVETFELQSLKSNLDSKKNELHELLAEIQGDEDSPQEGTITYLAHVIKQKLEEKNNLLKETENTEILAININEKLRKTGKNNLQLKVHVDESEQVEHYLIKDEADGVRDISKLSTGEKNIIAFLYFLEKLNNRENEQDKILIFDDPMTSNDDAMQYLIITELQKLYRGTSKVFNPQKDHFVCMTHNVHFYLNVPPQGYFKTMKKVNGEIKEFTKYNQNKFYWITNQAFKHIKSPKEDINTHYEYLWMELQGLYENNYLNSMLNIMRRIIETYIHFNKIHIDKFYKDKEEHLKIFNVNSHGIDDFSAEMLGKERQEFKAMFKELFLDNFAEEHFNTYWE